MSTLKVNNLQVGQDGTVANNYTLYQPASPDGTVRLGYGVAGSVTDILTLKNSRLGIGTNDPVRALDVHGGGSTDIVRFTNDSGTTLTFGSYSGMTTLDVPSSTGFRFRSGGSSGQHFTIDSSGNVIIGDSASDLSGNHTFMACGSRHAFQHDGNTGTYLSFTLGSADGDVDIEADARSGGYPDLTFTTTNDERLRITADGKVGINQTSPAHQLDVKISDNTTYTPGNFLLNGVARLHNESTTTNSFASLVFRTATGDNAIGFVYPGTVNQADFVICNDGGNNGIERFRITSDGKVRIANTDLTTNSSADDLIVGTTSSNRGISIFSATDGTGNIFFGDTDTSGTGNRMGTITYDHSNNYMRFSTNGNNERLRITSDGDVLPGADATQDFGSAAKRWANIYSADLQLSNEGAANDVDGTWGQYTIQEGEDDLFLINRRNGKKYKFMLQEVN